MLRGSKVSIKTEWRPLQHRWQRLRFCLRLRVSNTSAHSRRAVGREKARTAVSIVTLFPLLRLSQFPLHPHLPLPLPRLLKPNRLNGFKNLLHPIYGGRTFDPSYCLIDFSDGLWENYYIAVLFTSNSIRGYRCVFSVVFSLSRLLPFDAQ